MTDWWGGVNAYSFATSWDYSTSVSQYQSSYWEKWICWGLNFDCIPLPSPVFFSPRTLPNELPAHTSLSQSLISIEPYIKQRSKMVSLQMWNLNWDLNDKKDSAVRTIYKKRKEKIKEKVPCSKINFIFLSKIILPLWVTQWYLYFPS